MTYPDPRSSSAPAPPPGCPAHAQNAGGPWQRIYGPDAEPLGPVLEQLRRQYGDVAPVLVPGDIPAYLVLGYNAIRDVMQSNSRVVCDSRRGRVYQDGRIPADHPLAPMTAYQPIVAFEDGVPHARLRSAVVDSLDFNRHSLRRYIGRYANRLIDCVASRGTADLVTEYAAQLPALVMAWMYGMPEEESPALVAAVRDLTSGNERAAEGNAFVTRTMEELVRRRRAGEGADNTIGGRDFVSRLLDHEAGLSDQEVVEHLRMIFVAGYTPTVALIANTLLVLLTQRQFSRDLTSGQMTLPEALERVLWDHPPIGLLPTRWAAGDMTIAGQQIKAGDMIILGIEAANTDPAAREPGRPVVHNSGHLAFSTGPHECPGRDIGQAIAETGIDILLSTLRDLELAVPEAELQWQSAWVSRRLLSLPVTFTPPRVRGVRVAQPEAAVAVAGRPVGTA
ncbi:cytochrome P450 [Streptomyces rimosus]|uniref:cytochrome P450 n=1 Tax=Streptomyces rimosus TaxID=1927 RepID=UPI000A3F4055|nr:cytochrome P450 [Streptomyces rimosus]